MKLDHIQTSQKEYLILVPSRDSPMAKNMEATNALDGNYLGEETLITDKRERWSLEKDVSKQDTAYLEESSMEEKVVQGRGSLELSVIP